MRRNTLLLAVLVSLSGTIHAFGTCRSSPTWGYDVSTVKVDGNNKPIANANLFDYGVIFEDAGDANCAASASVALYKKVKATLNLPVYFDANTNRNTGPYQGWLEGANAGLVYATALRLGGSGRLTRPLSALIDQIAYTGYVDAYCGFASNRHGDTKVWKTQNSCMDDYGMLAHGYGWEAAWMYKAHNYPVPYDSAAKSAIWNALNTTESVCLHKTATPPGTPAPAAGPCTASVSDVTNGLAVAVALHNGDAMPYGIGLMTGVASGHNALSEIGQSVSFTSDQLTIAKSLYKNADAHTEWDPTYLYSFKSNCYSFSEGPSGELVRGSSFGCYEPLYGDGKTGGYQPEMFPVKDYYDAKLGGAPSTANYDFSTFQDNLFCDNPNDGNCMFFSPGRKAVYKTLAKDWVWSRPSLNAYTTDYTASFKTYDNAHYLSARNGGGSDVNAEPTSAGTNETFSMVVLTGSGPLSSGNTVYMQVPNGKYISAVNGGGSTVVAQYDTPLTWEVFTIEKVGGSGQILSGDKVALKALNGQYVSAVNGGGSNTVAQYTSVGTWEQFTMTFTH